MNTEVTEAAPDLPPAYRLLPYAEIDSTNAEARRLAAAGAGVVTVLLLWTVRALIAPHDHPGLEARAAVGRCPRRGVPAVAPTADADA